MDRLRALARRVADGGVNSFAVALEMSRRRNAIVLAREPWPDPASRDRREVYHSSKNAIDDAVAQAVVAAAEAQTRHGEATARVGVLDRVARIFGRETEGILKERAMAADAERLRIEADTLAGSHGRRLAQADADALGTVRRREYERARWLESPEVVAAVREARGNDLVANAIEADVPGVRNLAARNLGAARGMLLRHEQEQIKQQAIGILQAERRIQRRAGLGQQLAAHFILPTPGHH